MKVLKGIPVSPGMVSGTVCLYSEEEENVPQYNIPEEQVSNEIAKLRESIEKTNRTMRDIIGSAENISDGRAAEIFNSHRLILNDKVLFEKISALIKEKRINAEHAVNDIFEQYIGAYKDKKLHFRELTNDFMDLRARLLASFGGISGHFECPAGEKQPVIVASQRLTPSMVLNLPREKILAFLTSEGGHTTHATILARSIGVPVVYGIDAKEDLKCGDKVIVDGFTGKVTVSPDRETQAYYEAKIEKHNKRIVSCSLRKGFASRTKSNLRVILKLNISTPLELEAIKGFHHDGIGLLRTEFLFLERENPPSEQEQYEMYRSILRQAGDKPVSIRLLDIGPDKLPLFLTLPDQINPDMGIKGARAVEKFYGVYLSQAKAILRAAKYGDMRVLYPMVSDAGDILTFKKLMADAKKELAGEKEEFNRNIPDGIMIETPSAALLADKLLKLVDFANIGSNDLLQYTLAASRGIPFVEKRYHILHESMIRLFEMIIKSGKIHGKEICLCGEVASFEEFYPLFLKLGLRSFSTAASKFPYIKCELMHMGVPRSSDIVKKFYSAGSKAGLDRLFKVLS